MIMCQCLKKLFVFCIFWPLGFVGLASRKFEAISLPSHSSHLGAWSSSLRFGMSGREGDFLLVGEGEREILNS